MLGEPGNTATHSGSGKQQPQHRQDLRQNKRPAYRIQQTTRLLQRLRDLFPGHANRHHQADQRPGGHRKQRNQRGMITRTKHPDLPRWQVIKQQHPDHRDNRNSQRRIKQPVTQAGRAGGSLFLGALVIATQPDTAKTGDQRQRHDGNADGNIDRALVVYQLISPVAKQEQQTVQPPEQAGGQATRVTFVAP